MRKLILLIPALLLTLTACDAEPDKTICLKEHSELVYEYHYGYNFANGKHQLHFGPHNKTICDQEVHNEEWDLWNERQKQ